MFLRRLDFFVFAFFVSLGQPGLPGPPIFSLGLILLDLVCVVE